MKIAFFVSAVCLLAACGTPPAAAPEAKSEKATVTTVHWTFPTIMVNRAHCAGDVADCYEKAGELCQPRGAIAQEVDAHDIIFICKPKAAPAEQTKE